MLMMQAQMMGATSGKAPHPNTRRSEADEFLARERLM